MDITKERDNINIKLKEVNEEREMEKQINKNKINKLRNWVGDLIKLQSNMSEQDDLESDKFWVSYENKMDSILSEMKLEAQEAKKLNYDIILNNFKFKYGRLSSKALSCLATAEYLYKVNKESMIDFAPIIVEYSKVFEIELNQRLKLVPTRMLGELIYYIQGINENNWNRILNCLRKAKKVRNGSAHTGISTLAKVEEMRNMLFNEGWLEYILNLR